MVNESKSNTFDRFLSRIEGGVFISVFLYLTLENLISEFWEWNACDVLVYAKHFMNPQWIRNDWFLNVPIPYRFLFNIIAGTMALKMPFWAVELVGRILIISLFAYVLKKYSDMFDVSTSYMVCFLALYLAFPDIVASEWIFGGFETKPFSYFFVFLSLFYFVERRYKHGWLSLGAAVSFHVLVGIYATFCLLLTLFVNLSYFGRDRKKIIKSFPFYIITSSIGIYTICWTILANQNINTHLAGKLYVTLRVPHHTLPSFWIKYHGGYWWILELFLLITFLVLVFRKSKSHLYRIFSSFALCSSILFGIGLLLFLQKKIALLRYYWFRFPDVVLPFFSFFLFFSLLSDISSRKLTNSGFLQFRYVKRFIGCMVLTASLSLFVVGSIDFIKSFFILKQNETYFHYAGKDCELTDMMLWIRQHTPQDARFLISPYIEQFYMVAQRPIFVSFKHVPSSEKDIMEWYKRLLLCNNNKKIEGKGFERQNEKEFYGMREKDIKSIARLYRLDYYLGIERKNLTFPRIYKNRSYTLYKIADLDSASIR